MVRYTKLIILIFEQYGVCEQKTGKFYSVKKWMNKNTSKPVRFIMHHFIFKSNIGTGIYQLVWQYYRWKQHPEVIIPQISDDRDLILLSCSASFVEWRRVIAWQTNRPCHESYLGLFEYWWLCGWRNMHACISHLFLGDGIISVHLAFCTTSAVWSLDETCTSAKSVWAALCKLSCLTNHLCLVWISSLRNLYSFTCNAAAVGQNGKWI